MATQPQSQPQGQEREPLPMPVEPTQEQMQALLDDFYQWFVVEGNPPAKVNTWDTGYAGCVYRMEVDGRLLECAIGRNIPEEKYDPRMEGISATHAVLFVNGLVDEKSLTDRSSIATSLSFYERFQNLHDAYLGEPEFYEKLQEFCTQFNLTNPATR